MESILFLATLGAVFFVALWTIKTENAERKLPEANKKGRVVPGNRIGRDPETAALSENGESNVVSRNHRRF